MNFHTDCATPIFKKCKAQTLFGPVATATAESLLGCIKLLNSRMTRGLMALAFNVNNKHYKFLRAVARFHSYTGYIPHHRPHPTAGAW